MSHSIDRRSFLFGSSVAGFGILIQGRNGWAGGVGPNETINIGVIGAGGKGRTDTKNASNYARIAALCDIDEERLDKQGELYKDAKKFVDYRQMLDKVGKELDAVIVSCADHTHAPASVAAMRMGKHVYCQKPLTHSVWEARLMREVARQTGVCTQMGNQGSAEAGLRRGVEVVQSGAIGTVKEVHIWTNRPFKYWKQAPDIVARPEPMEIPKHVHWDLFLASAPERPYNKVYTPHDWRGWWDFGTGSLGDMACHTANLTFRALKLGLPNRVSAVSAEINPETYPAWATITYEFPARGDLPPVKVIWYEGAKDKDKKVRNLPDASLFPPGTKLSSSGSLLVGSKGKMFSPNDYGAEQFLLPEEEFKGYKDPEKTIPRIEGGGNEDDKHKKEWIEAIRAGKPSMAYSNFEFGSTITEAMLLGNVAVRSGEAIEYNGETGQIANSSTASQYLKPSFRKGWEL